MKQYFHSPSAAFILHGYENFLTTNDGNVLIKMVWESQFVVELL